MRRLSTQVIALALSALVVALVVVGIGTGVAMWFQATRALDQALIAAAVNEAHSQPAERWRPEHPGTPVQVRAWTPDNVLVTQAEAQEALADEVPRWLDRSDQRVLLLVAEPEGAPVGPDGDDADHPHTLLVASAPRLTPAAAVGPFALTYTAVSLLTAALLGALLVFGLRRALGPLEQAAARLDRLKGWEVSRRVGVDGPEEVQRVLTATNALLERLETASRGQRRFVANAAHELRTPVTRLLGELDLALRQPRSAEAYRQTIEAGRTQAAELRDLVEALLTLARLDGGQGNRSESRERERLSAVVLAALASERAALDRAGCTVALQLDQDPEVVVDVALCRVALGNLLRNAAVHAPGAPVRITVQQSADAIRLCVEDGGPGLAPEVHDRVFDRFHRARHDRPGLGLGLPLAREVIRQHGGELTLQASDLGGLAALVTLPAEASSH